VNLQEEYKIQLEVFEGPLDLLLYLIKKEEVDIYNIPIERIATQYMDYMNLMKMLDLNIAGEFLVMAATLMMIKSRMLLPVEERPELEEEEEDPRWELVKQLVEYKKFKDAASKLQERELLQENIFDLGSENLVFDKEDDTEVVLGDVSLFDLISAFKDVLKNARPEEINEIMAHRYTVADKIHLILASVKTHGTVRFTDLFDVTTSKPEMICTFLGLLELIKLRQINIVQNESFGEIVIKAAEAEPDMQAAEEAASIWDEEPDQERGAKVKAPDDDEDEEEEDQDEDDEAEDDDADEDDDEEDEDEFDDEDDVDEDDEDGDEEDKD
jgi:segregation and condensation protein A